MDYRRLISDTVNNLGHSEIDRIFEMAAKMDKIEKAMDRIEGFVEYVRKS